MLAVSALDVLIGIGLSAAGFIVVALVCAGVLAMLQLILPSVDTGAAEIDRPHAPAPDDDPSVVDTEADT